MFLYKLKILLVLLVSVLLFTGCSGVVESVKSGLSDTVSFFKASDAEAAGDNAYQNKNYSSAFTAYQTAAENGGKYGQFMLATMYLAGEGVKRDPKKYLHWMKQSADNGYPPANYLMGMAFLNTDAKVAAQHFQAAADREHGAAMNMLGLMSAQGSGVPQNSGEALRWFRMARAQGFPVDDKLMSEAGVNAYMAQAGQQAKATQARQVQVREIQQVLTRLGYQPGPVDGQYGGKTRSAIEAFQRDKGVAQDGLASEKLLEVLRAAH